MSVIGRYCLPLWYSRPQAYATRTLASHCDYPSGLDLGWTRTKSSCPMYSGLVCRSRTMEIGGVANDHTAKGKRQMGTPTTIYGVDPTRGTSKTWALLTFSPYTLPWNNLPYLVPLSGLEDPQPLHTPYFACKRGTVFSLSQRFPKTRTSSSPPGPFLLPA